ncbi:MAG: hypothetical protein BGP03_21080 [Pseudonocardia sp. 73-21]|nr:MAG: hypothetical protein BGP03_21080 [Pseudonocardia sp. 73-21]
MAPRPGVAAGDQQPAVRQGEEPLRLGVGGEVAADGAPPVAAHGIGAVMLPADPERHAVGQHAAEVGSQQRVEGGAVAGGERRVEVLRENRGGVHAGPALLF